MDCGPTCLRMIARFYGKNYSIQELRNRSFLNRDGASVLGISEAAEAIGFRTLAIKIPFEKFVAQAPLPCIVHWNQTHFVVVYSVDRSKVRIADPGLGKVALTHDEFARKWVAWRGENERNGVALLIEPSQGFYETDPETPQSRSGTVRFLFSYLHRYSSFLWQLAIGLFAGSIIQLIFPFLTQSIVDVGINTNNLNFIYIVLFGQLMLALGRTSVDFLRRWILLHLSTRINISLISDFLIKLMKLPLSFFDEKRIGDILNRIEDHTRIEHFLSSSSLNIVFSLFNFVIFGLVLLFYNATIFLVFVAGSFLYVSFILLFMKKRRELDYRRFIQMVGNQGNLIELVNGIHEIKLNNSEKQKRWKWERIQANLFHVNIGSTRLQQYQEAGGLFINESKNILITVIAAQAVIDGSLSLGMMLAVQYIIGQLNAPVMEFVTFAREYQDAKIGLERIGEIHQQKDEDIQSSLVSFLGADLLKQTRSINLTNVSFHYHEPDALWVLKDVNLAIPFGKTTAIVGTSGSGKTTLLKLLLKFYQPVSGSIHVGEVDLSKINSGLWRSRCGTVMQDGYIFSGSLVDNIAMGEDDPDPRRVMEAAAVANLHDYIAGLPFGYDTKLGDKGAGLSQGQKQRLLIARAVYRNPDYIFFDEATSSLDANNEKVIMKNLSDFFVGKTVIVIAHRLSTVKNADQIVVLEKGEIVEAGTHGELTALRGFYYELVRNQLELGN